MRSFDLPPLPRLRDAEAHSVWVIVPLSRPENLPHVIANFQRQRFAFKKLVLVENGPALGASAKINLGGPTTIVLSSPEHQSAAKNIALSEIRRRGGGFTVVMDDDDWYGPDYLSELCGYAKTYGVVGKARNFLSVDGALWYCSREHVSREVSWLTGGTIGCWAEDAAEYPIMDHGEHVAFCGLMRRRGATIWATSPYHYLQIRQTERRHAWRISALDLQNYEAERGGMHLGPVDLDVVHGARRFVQAEPLELHEEADTLVPPAPSPGAP